MAQRDLAQGVLGGHQRVGQVVVRPEPGGGLDQLRRGQRPQLLTQLCWGGQQQGLELVQRGSAARHAAAARNPQGSDRFDPAVSGLG